MRFKKDTLLYLGYKGQIISPELNNIIDECLVECKELAMPQFVYERYSLTELNDDILLNNSIRLHGNSIQRFLNGCDECYVVAVTLGHVLTKKIAYYQLCNLTKASILDACASAYLEIVCDEVSQSIEKKKKKSKRYTTTRFSPGYGDFSLNIQPQLVYLLKADIKIGVTVNDQNLLFPRKSVTALIGVSNKCLNTKNSKCNECSLKNCVYRKEN